MFERLLVTALVAVMAVNVVILFRILSLSKIDSFYREKKAEYILPDGFTPEKTKISWEESSPAPSGWVVRYASKGCIYCMLDYEWENLVRQLEPLNFRTILLLPKEADQFDKDKVVPETAQQMSFLKVDWVKQFRFSKTPTVVIFDGDGNVLWHHRGMMNNAHYKSAVKAITRNTK